MSFKILAINPGSTSTKIALYEDKVELFTANLNLDGINYNSTDGKKNLEGLRKSVIQEIANHGYAMEEVDAFVGRGGNMVPSTAGVYTINEKLMEENADYQDGRVHAATYSPILTALLANEYKKKGYILNSQMADELQIEARFTGYNDVWRVCALHALNHKEVAVRTAVAVHKEYAQSNIIVAHLGGGISIAAHKNGKMVDYSGCGGEGPMSPNRSGTIAAKDLIKLAFSEKYSFQELMEKTGMHGGLMDHLGTPDAREIEKRIKNGDEYAAYVYNTMIYQIAKYIGAMAVTLEGKVDAIALTGGLSNSEYLVDKLKNQIQWIAPIHVFAGEYEMEALAYGVLRVLQGKDTAQVYTATPVFDLSELLAKKRA